MRRQVRFHIRTLALILALAFCLSLVPATVLAEDDFAADQTQGETSTAPDTGVDQGPVESVPAPTQTVDVTVTMDGQGNVNVDVNNRPTINPEDPSKNEQHYTGTGSNVSATPDNTPSDEETTTPEAPEESAPVGTIEEGALPESSEQPTINATVNGSVTTTPGETETDEEGRPIHTEATVEGEESITIETEETTTGPTSTTTEIVGSGSIGSTGNILANAGNKHDQTLSFNYGGETIEINKADLIESLKPQGPEADLSEPGKGWTKDENGKWGYTTSQTDKDGNVITTTGTWTVKATEKNDGWITTEVTTETGTVNAGAYGYPGGIPLENGKPVNGPITNEDGSTTKVTENGNVITVVTTSEDGLVKTTVTYNLQAGSYTKTTTSQTTTTIEISEEKPGQVDITGITVGPGQGSTGSDNIEHLGSLKPSDKVLALNDKYYKAVPNNTGNYIRLSTGRYKYVGDGNGNFVYRNADIKNHLTYPFTHKVDPTGVLSYVEAALRSSVRINCYDANGNIVDSGHNSVMRLLKDTEGNEVYVYCSQNAKTDHKGPGYDIVTPGNGIMGTDHGSSFELSAEAVQHIQYIAQKGFWGTQTGPGSLAEIKKLVNPSVADKLDEGIALAVTQAAIWYYANDRGPAMFEKNGVLMDNIFTTCYADSNGKPGVLTAEEQQAAMQLFRALIAKGQNVSGEVTSTDIISQDKISGTSVNIKNEAGLESFKDYVAQQAGATFDEAQFDGAFGSTNTHQDYYETDLSLTIAVLPTDMVSDDMTLVVYANGVKVTEQPIFQEVPDRVTVNEQGQTSIVIPGVILPTGCDIRLNLTGTQHLNDGAYLFRTDVNYEGAQTMVGVVTAEEAQKTIDLDVTFNINNIQKPTATVTQTVSTTESTTEDREWAWDAIWGQDTSYPKPTTEPSKPPVPTQSPSVTPEPSQSPSVTPEPSESPSVTPEPSEEPTPAPTEKPTPEVTPGPQPTPTPVVTPTPQPTPVPTTTPVPAPTPTPTITPDTEVTPSAPQIPGGGIGDLIPEVPSQWPETAPSHGPANPVDPEEPEDDMEFVPEVTPDLPAASPSQEPDDDLEFVPEVTPDLPAASPSQEPDDDLEFVPEVTPDLPAAPPSQGPDIPVSRPEIEPEMETKPGTVPMHVPVERAAHRVPKTDDNSGIWWVMALTAFGCMTLLASRVMRRRKAD